jgi:hypothetical protein
MLGVLQGRESTHHAVLNVVDEDEMTIEDGHGQACNVIQASKCIGFLGSLVTRRSANLTLHRNT